MLLPELHKNFDEKLYTKKIKLKNTKTKKTQKTFNYNLITKCLEIIS